MTNCHQYTCLSGVPCNLAGWAFHLWRTSYHLRVTFQVYLAYRHLKGWMEEL